MDDALAFAGIQELASLLKKREISAVELAQYYLERIDRLNPQLNAFIAVTADRALASAQAAEEAIAGGNYLGPLQGIPIAVKDLVDVAGIPTTGGSVVLKDNVPARDAFVTRRLAQAGTVLLGKTHLVEFAFGGVGINHHYGTPWNPWDSESHRIPGGSSAGSAVAVAADLAPIAIGSDTGGSVRIPASFCGLVGLKTTFGRISNRGVLPLDSRLDSIGPLVRCVQDAAVLYQSMVGADPEDPDTWGQPADDVVEEMEGDVACMRICLPREYFWEDVDAEVEAALKASVQVFADMGVYVDEISLEELDDLAQLRARGSMTAVETYLNLGKDLEERQELFDPIVSTRMLDGREMPAHEYLGLRRDLEDLRRRAQAALGNVDALLTPTTPFPALPVEEVDQEEEYWRVNGLCLRNTSAANMLGLCAISLPCGFTRGGLPIGLQLIARPFEEARLLRLAFAYEQATDWSSHHPDLGAFE